MERSNTKCDYQDGIMVISRRRSRAYLWLARTTRRHKKIAFGMDTKMKTFLSVATAICFIFATFSGACIRTLADMPADNTGIIAAKLVTLDIQQLGEVDI